MTLQLWGGLMVDRRQSTEEQSPALEFGQNQGDGYGPDKYYFHSWRGAGGARGMQIPGNPQQQTGLGQDFDINYSKIAEHENILYAHKV